MDLPGGVDEDVDLAANAELGEVDAGLDRKAGAAEDKTCFVRFEVIHIRAVAVSFLADAVAGAVDEVLAVASFFDHIAGGLIDLPAAKLLAGGKALLYQVDRRIAGGSYDLKDFLVLLRHFAADEADAG